MIDLSKPTLIKDLSIYEEFVDIILNHELVKNINSQCYVSKEDTLKYVKHFFKDYDESYYKKLLGTIRQKHVVFNFNFPSTYSIADKTINISNQDIISDAFVLTHEFIHYVNSSIDKKAVSNPFRELIAILHEHLFSDYLSNMCIENSKDPIILRIQNDSQMSELAKTTLEIQKSYSDSSMQSLQASFLEYFNMAQLFGNNLDDYSYYLIGEIFSAYIHQNLLNKSFNMTELKQIRDFIMYRNYSDLSKALDLDFSIDSDGLNMSKGSIKVLEKAYYSEVRYYER